MMKRKEKGVPSTSFLLTKVPLGLSDSDIRSMLSEYGPLENVVLHYLSPTLFTHTATIVFPTNEAAEKFGKNVGKKVTKHKLKVFYSLRPDNHSLTKSPGQIKLKPQQDEIPESFNRHARNYIVKDWKDLTEVPEIPASTVYLSLRYNKIETFTMILENIESINLTGNNLKEMISLKSFPKLDTAILSHNLLEKMPELSETVRTVLVSYNRISEISENIKEAKCLETLDVSHNLIRLIPALPSTIKTLHCHGNKISSFDAESSLPNLSDLTLWHNELQTVPSCLHGKISDLTLAFNKLETIDVSMFVKGLKAVNLSMSNLTEVPAELFQIPTLKSLILFGNKITNIPDAFSTSPLESFNISENPISQLPRIPMMLQELKMNFCEFSDLQFIPSRNMLRKLQVTGNKLTELPPLPVIEEIFAASNKLTTVPMFNVDIFTPFSIDFSFNEITEIPPMLGLLRFFDFGFNKIEKLPDEIFKGRCRLTLTGNPITRKITQNDLGRVEAVDFVNTQIDVEEEVTSEMLLELMMNMNETESSDSRVLKFECSENVGYAEMQGMRPSMEDAIIVRSHLTEDRSLYGIFDGHSGSLSARYGAAVFPALLKDREFSPQSIIDVCANFQEKLVSVNEMSGTTMDLVMIRGNRAIFAHLGDGKIAVFDKNGDVRFETVEHIPKKRHELERLRDEKIALGRMRTSGILAMSRSLGDPDVEGMSNTPEITEFEISSDDKWIVMGCDGLWDDVDASEVKDTLLRTSSPHEAARWLRNMAYSRGSEDNISVIVIKL